MVTTAVSGAASFSPVACARDWYGSHIFGGLRLPAAQYPVQAAAGFLSQIDGLPDLSAPPFNFPPRYQQALQLVTKRVRTFATTSIGRLFDSAAALVGFTRAISFEGQAAMWLEALAHKSSHAQAYPFPYHDGELDFRPLLLAVAEGRRRGREPEDIARAFQRGVAQGMCEAIRALCLKHKLDSVVLSGGVFQNELLLADVRNRMGSQSLELWTNHSVPANDGGISLGQAALSAFTS